MDKEFLKEQNLEGAQSRFQSILEYVNSVDGGTFMQRKPLAEAEDDMPMPDPQGAPEGMPEGMPGDVPPQGDMGGEMPPMEEPMGDTNMGAENFNPNVPPQEPEVAAPAEEEEEEVIDVDDLTDAQEETKDKVSDLDTKIDKFIGLIDKLESEIEGLQKRLYEKIDEQKDLKGRRRYYNTILDILDEAEAEEPKEEVKEEPKKEYVKPVTKKDLKDFFGVDENTSLYSILKQFGILK